MSGSAAEFALAHKGGTISGALMVKDTLSVSGSVVLGEVKIGILNESQGTDVTASVTTDLANATGNYNEITGTASIVSLGSISSGARRLIKFNAVMVWKNNATSMILPGGNDITTQTGDIADVISLGSGNWQCLHYQRLAVGVLHAQQQETSGTDGGAIAGGTWVTRVPNTEITNTITGASINTTTGRITLPAGTYDVEGWVSAYRVGLNKSRLYNVTDAAEEIPGSSEFTNTTAGHTPSKSFISKRITITDSKDFDFQHKTTTSSDTTDGGRASSFGTEVYVEIKISKVNIS